MLKIECGPSDQNGDSPCSVELVGDLAENIAELMLAVKRIHGAILVSNPIAAKFFQRSVQRMVADPEYWNTEPSGRTVDLFSTVFPAPREKKD